MSKIVLTNVDKFYGKNHVLKNLNLIIQDGDFMTLLGPSGCGKTTTLRVVSGLEKPQNGFIHMDGKEIVNAAEAIYAPSSKRNLNLVFQSYALWSHMTVFDNLSFGLKIRKESSEAIEKKVASALERILERMQIGEYAKRYTANFIGNPSINFIKGTAQVDAGRMDVDSAMDQQTFDRADMTPEAPQGGTVEVTLGLRPEQVTISKTQDDDHRIEVHVYSGMPAGSETLVTVQVDKELVTVKELGSTHYGSDEKVFLGFNPKKVNIFDTASENLIKCCV